MSSMKCVYVAGAYSGVCTTDIQDNMRRGMLLAHKVLMAGFSPFTPWHDFLHSLFGHVPLKAYYAFSMAQLETSHAVIVVPERAEQSLGTQREIKRAKELGIPVFWSMPELCDWGDRVGGRVPLDPQTGEPLPPIVDDEVSFRGQSEDEYRVSGKGVSQPRGRLVDEEGALVDHPSSAGCNVFAPYEHPFVEAAEEKMAEEDREATDVDKQSESNILLEAHGVTAGPRQRDYDHPKPNHERIARLWNAYLKSRPLGSAEEISSEGVCWMMIMVKMSRDMFCPKRDNLVDVAGYARCIEQIREGAELNEGTLRREGCKPPSEK